jgi:hypothetical protein
MDGLEQATLQPIHAFAERPPSFIFILTFIAPAFIVKMKINEGGAP